MLVTKDAMVDIVTAWALIDNSGLNPKVYVAVAKICALPSI